MISGINSAVYMEIDLFAVLVLLIIMDHSPRAMLSKEQQLFKLEEISVIGVLCFDACTWFANGIEAGWAYNLNLLSNYLYWVATLFPCYIGLLLCAYKFSEQRYAQFRRWATLPIWAGLVLLFVNLETGWIFTISPDNIYSRGPFFFLVGFLPFLDVGAGLLLCRARYYQVPTYARQPVMMLALAMFLPAAGATLQIFFYGLVTNWIGLTIALLLYYVYIQRGSLFTDALTGVNNRGRFDSYTDWKWSVLGPDDTLYLIILDINKFKAINDTYGHAEGDRALVLASNVLKQVMATENGFLARIGGDEFAIVLQDVGEIKTQTLIADIHTAMEKTCVAAGLTYQISFAAGYAGVCGTEGMDFSKLFSQADAQMYRQKHPELAPDAQPQ